MSGTWPRFGAGSGAAAGAAAGACAKSPGGAAASGSRHQARDLLEGEASLLEDAALVKLAYVDLCRRDFAGALRCSRRLLEKNLLLAQPVAPAKPSAAEDSEESRRSWAFQAQNLPQSGGAAGAGSAVKCPSSVACVTLTVNYAAEALLALGRPADAKALLGSFVSANVLPGSVELLSGLSLEQHIIGGASARPPGGDVAGDDGGHAEAARSVCGGCSPSRTLGGLSPPGYILQSLGGGASQPPKDRAEAKGDAEKEKASASKESSQAALVVYPPSEYSSLGETQCVLYTNLAAIHVQDGNLDEAEACCEKALHVTPRALAPLRTLVYVFLRRGNHVQALRRLKQSRL